MDDSTWNETEAYDIGERSSQEDFGDVDMALVVMVFIAIVLTIGFAVILR